MSATQSRLPTHTLAALIAVPRPFYPPCLSAEEARRFIANLCYCNTSPPSGTAGRLTEVFNRGDGACGKTSLLNVFTRGLVVSPRKQRSGSDAPCALTATSLLYTSLPFLKTTSTISLSIMYTSSSPSGIPPAKKNSTGYAPSLMTTPTR